MKRTHGPLLTFVFTCKDENKGFTPETPQRISLGLTGCRAETLDNNGRVGVPDVWWGCHSSNQSPSPVIPEMSHSGVSQFFHMITKKDRMLISCISLVQYE